MGEFEEDLSARSREDAGESPLSGEEEAYAPLTKKSRKGAQKRIVTVPIGGGDGLRNKGEVHPPPDSWSWRKYGQKPIKGSPYPRGYYRCSSSKGCPARKQVERSRHDPTTVLITYSSGHNHPQPTNTRAPVRADPALAAPEVSVGPREMEAAGDGYSELAGELGWFCDVGSSVMDGITFVGPVAAGGAEMEAFSAIGEEDELLFGDLGDLPECSLVFRRVEAPCCGGAGFRVGVK